MVYLFNEVLRTGPSELMNGNILDCLLLFGC